MSALSSPAQTTFKLDKISVNRNLKYSHSLYQWFTELEESGKLEDCSNSNSWKQRYLDLEKKYNETVNASKWLNERIKELEHSANQRKSEVENAVAARDGTLSKLKHARKVIRDLLVERSDMQSPGMELVLTQDEINEALYDEYMRNRTPASTPGSSPTIRRHSPVPTLPSSPTIASPPRAIRPIPYDSDRMVATTSFKRGMSSNTPAASPSTSRTLKHLSKPPSPSFQTSRPSPAYSTVSLESEQEIYLHYSPPSSQQVLMGPYSKEKLHQDLDLNISDVDALSRITSSAGLGLKLHITQSAGGDTMAFLYSPAFLEGSKPGQVDCRLIEWGRPQDAQQAKTYINSKKKGHDVFHTFTLPTTMNGKRVSKGWYYLGAMEWVDADVDFEPPVEERVKIVRELYHRTKKTYSKEMLNGMMERHEVKSFGVVLKKVKDEVAMKRFLKEHDGLNIVSPSVAVARVMS